MSCCATVTQAWDRGNDSSQPDHSGTWAKKSHKGIQKKNNHLNDCATLHNANSMVSFENKHLEVVWTKAVETKIGKQCKVIELAYSQSEK